MAIQGFGRYALLGPPVHSSIDKVNWRLDWGCLVWGPIVLAGAIWAGFRGRAQLRDRQPPTAWAILLQAIVAIAVITMNIPLAWDRYFLPIQAGSSLLAAGAIVAAFDLLTRKAFDPWKVASIGVFLTLFMSYAFYWHARLERVEPSYAHLCDRRSRHDSARRSRRSHGRQGLF